MTHARAASQNWLKLTLTIFTCLAAMLVIAASAHAAADTFTDGDGHDPAVTFGNGTHIPNALAPLGANVSAGATSLTIGAITAGSGTGPVTFANGRLVLIMQTNGWTGTATSGSQTAVDMTGSRVGKWELARITTYSSPTLTFADGLVNSYDAANTQVVAVPEYDAMTVNNAGANITGRAWNGTIGGVVAILVDGTVDFTAAGTVQANGLGFRGGVAYDENASVTNCPTTTMDAPTAVWEGGMKGEGIYPSTYSLTTPGTNGNQKARGNYLNGAGGGNCFNASGGGGSNAGAGGIGGNTLIGHADGNRVAGGLGGASLTYNVTDRSVFGGGGGAGERNDANPSNGGAGGGFVLVRGTTLSGTGSFRANGTAGANGNIVSTPYPDGAGGGGAGGVVQLRMVNGATCTGVSANGGAGGNNVSDAGISRDWTPGGGGGGGRTYVQGSSVACAQTATAGAAGTNGANTYGAAPGTAGGTTSNATGLTAPVVSLGSPAANAYTTDTTPDISGTGATANATIYVYVDGSLAGSTTANGSGVWSYTSGVLTNAAHTYYLRAELNGISSANTATRTFTVDNITPTVSVTGPANGSYVSTATPTRTFSVTETNQSTTECNIDGGAWAACTSGTATASLSAGSHTLNVRHTDLAGNIGSGASTFTVDLTDPVVSISAPANGGYVNTATPTRTFSVTETNSGTTECNIDGGAWAACTSGTATASLTAGSHTLNVRHTDLSGRIGTAASTFTVDLTNPVVSISAPTAGYVTTATPTLSFSVTETNLGTTECSVDAGAYSACTSGNPTASLSEGAHTLNVRHTDLAGRQGSASVAITVDTINPVVSISSPTAGYQTTTTPTLSFSVTESNLGTTECSVDAGAYSACTSGNPVAALSQGAHTLNVRHTDLAGRQGNASVSITVDSIDPVINITAPTAGYVTTATPTLSFSITEANLGTTECRVDAGAWSACTSGNPTGILSQGARTLSVRHTDLAGRVGTASVAITVDTINPVVSISAPANGSYVTSATPTLSFSVTDANPGTSECRVDGGSWNACTSGNALASLSDGSHTVDVRHTDLAGRVSSTESTTFTVDTINPAINITAPTAGYVTTTTPTLSFSVTETNLGTTTCSVDAGAYSACTSGNAVAALSQGAHTLNVRHVDLAGRQGDASVAITVDTIAPDAPTIDSGPTGTVNTDSANFSFTGAEGGGTYECRIDGGSWTSCTSPANYTGLSDAAHTFEVRQIDDAGNIGTEASQGWTVDTTPPPAPSVNGPTGTVGSNTADITFSDAEPGVTFECSVDGGAYSACTSPVNLTGLSDGPHSYAVRALDGVGNTSSSTTINWTVDSSLFTTSIDSAPTGVVGSDAASISFSATLGGSDFHCSLDGGSVYNCTSPEALTGLSEGSHTFEVYATNGSQTTPTVSATWIVDTIGPSLSIDDPTDGQTTGPQHDFFFTASDPNGPVTTTCAFDGGSAAPCTTGDTFSGLTDGAHTFTVVATDAASNNTVEVRNFNVDAVDPETTIDSAPSSLTNSTDADFEFSSNEAGTFECRLDAGAWGSCTSPVNLTGLSETTHTFEVRAIDSVGNTDQTPASHTWTIDATAPNAPTIDAPGTDLTIGDDEQTIGGTAEPNSTVTIYDDGVQIGQTTADGSGDWQFDALNLSDGPHPFTVTATDAANNTSASSNTRTITVDTTAPNAPVITTPATDIATSDDTPTISGTAEANAEITVFDDGTEIGTTTADGLGDWSFTPSSALSAGPHPFTATATDLVGNESASSNTRTITIDTTTPSVTIDSPLEGAILAIDSPDIEFQTSDNDSLTIECSIDGGSYVPCSSPFNTGSLSDGSHYVTVRATDSANNAGTAVVNFTIDTTAPAAATIDAPATDLLINDDEQTIGGTAEPDSEVTIYDNGVEIGTTTADGIGNWTYNATGLSEGAHPFTATATDEAGNEGPASNTRTITVDTIAPAAPVITSPAVDTSTNNPTPTISGTAEPNSEITVFDDGTEIGTATTNGSGDWSFTPGSALSDGPHPFTVTATDAALNESGASNTRTITIDTADPTITIDSPSNGAIIGQDNVDVAFTAGDDGSFTTDCSIDGGAFAPCGSPFNTGTLTDGSHSVTVSVTDAGGNVASAGVTFTIDTTAPAAATIDAPATDLLINDDEQTIGGTAEPNSTVTIYDNGVFVDTTTADVNGDWTYNATGLSAGAHPFTATATDAAGNEGPASNTRTITVDTIAPSAPTIDAPMTDLTINDSDQTIGGTAEPNSTVTVYDDGVQIGQTTADGSGDWEFDALGLIQGSHPFTVTATDAAMNTSGSSNTRTITVDTEDPAVSIDSPSEGTTTNDNTPEFAFSATDNGSVTTTCWIDSDTPVSCTSPFTPAALTEGPHTFTVLATDAGGNTAQAMVNFTVDTIAPTAPVVSAPADGIVTNDDTPIVSGVAEPNSVVTVYIDGIDVDTTTADVNGDWTYTSSSLSDGPHTVKATASDAANNTSADSNTNTFTVDTSLPSVSISSPLEGATLTDDTPEITFSATDNGTLTVTCSVDGGSFAPCSSPFTTSSLSDGPHSVTVRGEDDSSNVATATVNFTVDTTAPAVPVITSPAADGYTNVNTPTIGGTADPNVDITIYDNGVEIGTTTSNGSGDWSFTTPVLTDAAHPLTATSSDAYGNESVPSNTRTLTVDTDAPDAPTIDDPADGSATNDTTPAISGTAEANSSVEVFADGNSIGTTTADGSGDWSLTPGTPLGQGTYVLTAVSTDAAGNDSADSNEVELTIDTTDPSLTIDSPSGGSTLTDDTPDITFTGNDPLDLTYACQVDSGAFNACASPFTTAPLADGSHTVTVRATDEAGNSTEESVTFSIDTTGPNTSFTQVPPAITNEINPVFEFTSSEGNSTFACSLDSGPWLACTSPHTLGPMGDGNYSLAVAATDQYGNIDATPATYLFEVDTALPPAPEIDTPTSPFLTNDATPTITGTAEANSTVTIYDDGTAIGTTTADGSGDWSFTPSSSLINGLHEITATAMDAAGNEGPDSNQVDITVDTVAPSTTLTDTPDSPSNDNTPTFEFESNDPGATFECRIDSGSWTSCTSPFTASTLLDGSHTFEVRATDAAGNTDSTPASHTWDVDTTPPAAPVITAPVDGAETNDTTPTVSGTAAPGSTVTVEVDDGPACTATANGSGNWSCTLTTALSEGDHTFTATATDAAGNTSADSTEVDITVDTTAPDGTVVTSGGTPEQPQFTITSDDPTATVSCALTPGGAVPCTPPTYIPSGLAPGDYTLTVTWSDGAGNTTVKAITFSIPAPPTPTPNPPQPADPTKCFAKGVTIYNMKIKGSKMIVSGFARTSYAGKQVTVNFQPTKSKVLGKGTVAANGSFTVTVPAPAKKLRKKASTRYRANVPGESSAWFKFDRRMGSNEASYSNGKLNVTGFLTKPLDPKATLVVTARTGCNEPWRQVGTGKINPRTGAFTGSFAYQPSSGVVFVRMYAKVRKFATSKKTMTTYSFIIPVVTGEN